MSHGDISDRTSFKTALVRLSWASAAEKHMYIRRLVPGDAKAIVALQEAEGDGFTEGEKPVFGVFTTEHKLRYMYETSSEACADAVRHDTVLLWFV